MRDTSIKDAANIIIKTQRSRLGLDYFNNVPGDDYFPSQR